MSLLLLLALFGFTAFAARMYHKKVHLLADDWYAKGEAAFQAGNAAQALEDYRNALVFSPANEKFQFHLAQALAATGRGDEARAYLLNLLSESPGSGEINLALARIAARQGSLPMALRFYHGAIYGEWDTDPIEVRWQVRRELCEYLFSNPAASPADGEAEIIQLVANTPPDDAARVNVAGNLLLRAQMWTRALGEFQVVLVAIPKDADALAGAGTAAFQLGHYSQALEYLNRLPRSDRATPRIADMIQNSRGVLAEDPYLPVLSNDQKAQRASQALVQAAARIQECALMLGESLTEIPPKSELQQLFATSRQRQLQWSERNLLRHPDRVDAAMSFAFSVENLTAQRCGDPQGADRPLWLLMRSRQGGQR